MIFYNFFPTGLSQSSVLINVFDVNPSRLGFFLLTFFFLVFPFDIWVI
jgi:hypothetical protein